MERKKILILIIIIIGAFVVRLYGFSNPVLDWHSWRQVDTSSVSRNFLTNGFDILYPTFHDLSKGVSLLDNPNGYRFVEFPFYNILQAGSFLLFGNFTLEQWGRIISIFSSLISIVIIFLFVEKYISTRAGLISAFFFAFAPYSVYYSRTLLPDSLMVTFMISGIYFFDRWVDNTSKKFLYFLSLILTTCSILMKPFVLFFSLAYIVIAWNKFGIKALKRKDLWFFGLSSISPFILWRFWISHFPEGIPQSNWLFNGSEIRFKGAFFQWIFADRLSKIILGYFGLPFLILGILSKTNKGYLLFLSMIISSFLYLNVIATGNVQHDYYQLLIFPVIAIFFGKGVDFVLTYANTLFNKYTSYVVVSISIVFMLCFSWYIIRDYYSLQHINAYYAGKVADRILPKDAKVIAPFGGDTSLLYYTNRSGWPVVDRSFKDFVKAGANYIVFADPIPSDLELKKYFETVDEGPNYLILNINKTFPESIRFFGPNAE